MKRLYLIIAVMAVFIITGNAVAQEAAPRVFTLQECIDYALENAVPAQNAKIDEQIAQAKVRETIGIGLPQIDGAASVQHNQQLRRFFGTYIANPGEGDFTFFPPGIEGAEDGDVLAAQSPFQLKSSGDAGLTINQIIFNGSYVVGLQASKAYKDLAIKSSAQTKEQIIQQVTKAYYAVLINKERSELFTSNIARVDTLLRNTRALFQNGFAESIDADRFRLR